MKINKNGFLLICIIFASLFLSIGYATVNNVMLTISGTAAIAENGEVAITNVILSNYHNLQNPTNPSFTKDSISFNLNFKVANNNAAFEKAYDATYEITLNNDSLYDYAFASSTFKPSISTTNNDKMTVTYTLDDIELNEIIPAKTTRVFHVTINMYPLDSGNFNVSGEAGVDVVENDEGVLIASVPKDSTGDLRGNNTMARFTANVLNSHQEAKSFTFSINNNNFDIVDSSGNPIGNLTIDASETREFEFYIQRKPNVKFAADVQNLNVYLEPTDGEKSSMGLVQLLVDKDPTLTDVEAPVISNVAASLLPEKGKVQVSWTGTDDVGIKHYTIETYQVNGNSSTKISTNNTEADETTYTVTDLADGTYFFKVYGTDTSDNTATQSEIDSCSTSAGTCSRNNQSQFKWTFSVTFNLTNAKQANGTATTVDYGETYTATIQGTGDYNAPSSLTVKMGSTTLTVGTHYTYDSTTGVVSVYNVTDNLTISGSGRSNGCLAKGTNILLANGKTKKVEDIGYDDLLAVWNYDLGEITYEYPLWIENEHKASSYTRVTFSDGTYIDLVNNHALYSTDLNLFVNFTDTDNFKIGTNIAKINKDGTLTSVSVKNIENINKETTYYFVGTTTYYNVIANNILTTDGNTIISNLYGFEDGAKWPKYKKLIVENSNNILGYEFFEDVLPYYLYKGFRAGEAGYLINNNIIDLNSFKKYITTLIVNKNMLKEPITINNNRYWMVSTNLDQILDNNKNTFLRKEGSYYTLPIVEGVKYWYSTSDNKIYKPGEYITVDHGMHFIANKKAIEK